MTLVSKTFELFGKTYVLESGELAKQATGRRPCEAGGHHRARDRRRFQGA